MPKTARFLLLCLTLVPAISAGQNLLVNPEFDATTNSWAVSGAGGGTIGPDDDDANACANSGSIFNDCPFSFCNLTIAQCVSLAGIEDGAVRARASVKRVSGSFLQAKLRVTWYFLDEDTPCSTLPTPVLAALSPPIGVWTELALDFDDVPIGAFFAKVEVEAENPGAMVANLDHVYFGSNRLIFAEDHEIGESCRYSSTQP